MRTLDRLTTRLLPEFLAHFSAKNADYSDAEMEPHRVLGKAGQFSDIWRKIWKLKKALWDGKELTQESTREILLDLIGHCFLTLALLEEEDQRKVKDDVFRPHTNNSCAVDPAFNLTPVHVDEPHRYSHSPSDPGPEDHPPHPGMNCREWYAAGGRDELHGSHPA